MSTLLVETQKMVEDDGEEEKMINGAIQEVHDGIKELHLVATKGRPPQSKSSQQNSSQKSAKARICRVCKKSDHDYRNCKVRKRKCEESMEEDDDDFE